MEDRRAAYPLTRLIATAGGVIVAAAAIALAWHIERTSRTQTLQLAEQYNVVLTRDLGITLAPDLDRILAQPVPKTGSSPSVEDLLDKLKSLTRGSAIAKLKLYAPSGMTVFSSDPAQIGEDKSANDGFRRARGGEVASLLVFRDQFDAFDGVLSDRNLLSSYVPLAGSNAPGSVIEIYQDVTPILDQVQDATYLQQGAIVVAFALVYVLLLGVVARAESVALQRAAEAASFAAVAARADAASRTKTEFLASMSHELRTPLNAILGFVEILKSELFGPIENPRYRGYLADVHRAAQHLLAIINDVLDLERIEAGAAQLEIHAVGLGQIAETAMSMVQVQADAARIALRYEPGPAGAPVIESDGRLIRQILLNLLANAVKFTPSGGTVRLSLGTAGTVVTLTVSDTGPGMSHQEISTALSPYGQVERINEGYGARGTGLGLPIAERLTEILGGRLEIESEPGRGTRVTGLLPKGPRLS